MTVSNTNTVCKVSHKMNTINMVNKVPHQTRSTSGHSCVLLTPSSAHLLEAGPYPEGDVDQNGSHTGLLNLFKHFGQSAHCFHGDKVLGVSSVIHPCHEGRQDGGGELGHLMRSEEGMEGRRG